MSKDRQTLCTSRTPREVRMYGAEIAAFFAENRGKMTEAELFSQARKRFRISYRAIMRIAKEQL